MDFSGKNIWIIGASSGIGEALARELASQGASLALSARRQKQLDALNKDLGGEHEVLPLDVTDVAALQSAVKTLQEKWSRIDSVIFMAAIYAPTMLNKLDIEQTHKMVDVNLNGAFNTVFATLPALEKGSQIALCASVAGYRGLPGGQPYSATKAAIINLAESLRAEQSRKGIDVKVINPGFVETPLTDKNDFDMPMITTPEKAAKAIAKGLKSRSFEIHFPKKFTFLVKLVSILPAPLYFFLMNKK